MSANRWIDQLVFTGTATGLSSWMMVPKGIDLTAITVSHESTNFNGSTVNSKIEGTNVPGDVNPNDTAPNALQVFDVVDGAAPAATADAGAALGGSDGLVNLRNWQWIRLNVAITVAVPDDMTVTAIINAVYEQ